MVGPVGLGPMAAIPVAASWLGGRSSASLGGSSSVKGKQGRKEKFVTDRRFNDVDQWLGDIDSYVRGKIPLSLIYGYI